MSTTTYDYGTASDEALSIVTSIAAIQALESASSQEVTLPAVALKHLLNLQSTFSRRITGKANTPENREKYAAYCERMALKNEKADIWETWSRRDASIAFVLTHTKQADGSWVYNPSGEVLLRVQQNINSKVDAILHSVDEKLSAEILSNATASLEA